MGWSSRSGSVSGTAWVRVTSESARRSAHLLSFLAMQPLCVRPLLAGAVRSWSARRSALPLRAWTGTMEAATTADARSRLRSGSVPPPRWAPCRLRPARRRCGVVYAGQSAGPPSPPCHRPPPRATGKRMISELSVPRGRGALSTDAPPPGPPPAPPIRHSREHSAEPRRRPALRPTGACACRDRTRGLGCTASSSSPPASPPRSTLVKPKNRRPRRYIREGSLFRDNAAAQLGL